MAGIFPTTKWLAPRFGRNVDADKAARACRILEPTAVGGCFTDGIVVTRIVSHRGACRVAPENTIVSGRRAAELGADIVELDVRESADGVLYVLHDATLNRTTNGHGPISRMQSRDLDRLDAGVWFGPEFSGEPLPRLIDFLTELKPLLGFYVEVKAAAPCRLAAELEAAGLGSGCIIYSENDELRTVLRKTLPHQLHMVNYRDHPDIEDARAAGASILEFHSMDMTSQLISCARAQGFEIMMHTPRHDESAFRQALVAGVEYLNIDYPATALTLRREIQGA